MTEKEDTIKRIERVLSLTHKDSITVTIPRLTAERAVSLLKEQEPKLVRIDEDSVHCPSCGNELFTYPRQKYCDECGQAVKWQ